MTHRVLIITDKESDAAALVGALSDPDGGGPLAIEHVSRVSEAEARRAGGDIDVMLAELSLPDSHGIGTFERLRAAAPETPILVLCGEEGDPAVPEALRRGGQGPLPKAHFGSSLVLHAVRTLIERKAVEASLFVEKARTLIALNSVSDAVIGTDSAALPALVKPWR